VQEFISKLTWVDYLAAIAVLRGFYVGYKSGFFPEILRIASYVITVIVTFHFKDTVAEYLTLHTFLNSSTAAIVSFVALAAGTLLLTKLVTMLFLKLLKVGDGGFFNKVIGLLLGAARWIIILSLAFMLIDYSPLQALKNDIKTRSVTGPTIASIAPQLFDFLSGISPQLAVKTPATTAAPAPVKAK
jgi:uncharacterized membrane protein required for colicin V production